MDQKLNKNELFPLTLHESIPGHHYERKLHINDSKIPLYFKSADFTGYVEGWGLYCESFEDYYTDDELIYRYMYEIHRAARLVVDTGIHYYKWSFKKTFDYMKKYLNLSDEEIKNEILRYICDPGQACAYKIGEITLMNLRSYYFCKYPNDYKGFHKLVMCAGPCELETLIKKVINSCNKTSSKKYTKRKRFSNDYNTIMKNIISGNNM